MICTSKKDNTGIYPVLSFLLVFVPADQSFIDWSMYMS